MDFSLLMIIVSDVKACAHAMIYLHVLNVFQDGMVTTVILYIIVQTSAELVISQYA